MDITVRISPLNGDSFSKTFIGSKKDILPSIRAYIRKHGEHQIDVVSQEDKPDLTWYDLFAGRKEDEER